MPFGIPYPEELHDRARELAAEGLGVNQIASEIDVPQATVRRWLNPQTAERDRLSSRRHKEKRRRECRNCGKKVWYTSMLCADCSRQAQRDNRYWTQERVIRAIQEWAMVNGKPPTATDWMRAGPGHPAATGIYGQRGCFRYWNDAIAAAGFTPNRTSPGPGKSKWSKSEARRLREEGLTDREIAKRIGVSPSAIGQRIGPREDYQPRLVKRKRTREQRIADLQRALQGEQDGGR